jgi:hypothetical protein
MPTMKTPEQIRNEGLAILEQHLGRAGMLQFLQQFDAGAGDYANERHAWVDTTSAADIKKQAKSRRDKRAATR